MMLNMDVVRDTHFLNYLELLKEDFDALKQV